jgi:hypothetical protein
VNYLSRGLESNSNCGRVDGWIDIKQCRAVDEDPLRSVQIKGLFEEDLYDFLDWHCDI